MPDASLAAQIVQRVTAYDARQLAFDPLAVFYLAQPQAFGAESAPMAVHVSEGAKWRFEQCAAADAPDAVGVVEFSGVSLERYGEWLTRALTQRRS